ncbi:alpha/beta fold hydrolase [Sphingomonas immobilis]|uniref:Alpha/beta hydrolase n=1 Tax=Sphingomonas immobilis TaxID=3063997 RepID=A0ABT9A1D7_9SPHN|nr:alpha/beta hydrolase [Sphingomonas sp. CA1-15]MDO7843638.1 alpha/beta hydrolase [Sphingomonas sp. CA1-15]
MTDPANDAPVWFIEAINRPHVAHISQACDCSIQWLEWGSRDRPTLLLLHGILAHAGWWRAVAGLMCDDWHVVAPSWPGMGGSQWRERYSKDDYTATLIDFAIGSGLFEDGRRPVIAAHSFGAVVALGAVGLEARFGGLIMIDRAIEAEFNGDRIQPSAARRHFATVAEARARYRLFPEEPAPDFIIDQVVADGLCAADGGGHYWRQDPMLLRDIGSTPDLSQAFSAALCPVAFVRGDASEAFDAAREVRNRAITPSGTPHLVITRAGHHVPLQNPPALAVAIAILASKMIGSSTYD